MKKLFLSLVSALALAGCNKVEKDVHDYFPKVKIIKTTALPDGSLEVTGEFEANDYSMEYMGFCLDSLPNPGMKTNQHIAADADINGNQFKAVYKGLSTVKPYYVRAWAVNENGYHSLSDNAIVTGLGMDTSALPCKPAINTYEYDKGFGAAAGTIRFVDTFERSSNWQLTLNATTPGSEFQLKFEFKNKPISGTYNIFEGNPSGNNVSVWFTTASQGTYVLKTGKIYVQQIDASTVDVTLCDVVVPGFNYHITTKFRSPSR